MSFNNFFLNNRFQRLRLLAFDLMVRIKYYKGYVEPGGSIFKGVRYVGGGGLTYYIYEVTIITCIMLMIYVMMSWNSME